MNSPVRRLPDVPVVEQMSAWTKLVLWFSMNRAPIGTILTSLSTIALGMSFENHAHVAAILSALAMIVGGVTAGGGAFKSDTFHEEKVNREIKQRSGAFPRQRYGRRIDDKE